MLARVLCWMGLVMLLVAIVVMIARGLRVPLMGTLLMASPLASTLAALHFRRESWLGWVAVIANAVFVLSFGLFVFQMLLMFGSSGAGQAMALALPVLVGSINIHAAWPRRHATKASDGS